VEQIKSEKIMCDLEDSSFEFVLDTCLCFDAVSKSFNASSALVIVISFAPSAITPLDGSSRIAVRVVALFC
jgi:hypothetical protein